MPRTLYRIEDGTAVVVHDSVDAKEYLATQRYTATPPEPLAVLEPAVVITEQPALEVKKNK
jgi:hypothetical protein